MVSLSEKTGVPFGWLLGLAGLSVTVIFASIGGAFTVFSWRQADIERQSAFEATVTKHLTEIEGKVVDLSHHTELFEQSVRLSSEGRILKADVRAWILQAKANPKYSDLPNLE